ncbi:MAG: helix-turn-helix transcriptional regulator [Chitinophagaceae bacterium]
MNNFKAKISKVTGSTPSKWKQQAAYRLENEWLIYSSQIARRILAIIHDSNHLTQSKLAEMLEVSPQQINKIVKGKENLTLETIYKLSKALNVNLITFPEYKYSTPLAYESFQPSQQAKIIPLPIFTRADKVVSSPYVMEL